MKTYTQRRRRKPKGKHYVAFEETEVDAILSAKIANERCQRSLYVIVMLCVLWHHVFSRDLLRIMRRNRTVYVTANTSNLEKYS